MSEKWTISDIKAANKRAGRFFFSRATIRFFRSCTLPYVYQGDGGIYFVTSESDGPNGRRHYTVRRFFPETGEVETAGEYGNPSKELARERASEMARRGS